MSNEKATESPLLLAASEATASGHAQYTGGFSYSCCLFTLAALMSACDGGNSIPEVFSITLQTAEDSSVDGLMMASDPDGDPVTFQVFSATGGAVINQYGESGRFRYTPGPDVNGAQSFVFTATDQRGRQSLPGIVTINVLPMNDAPVIEIASYAGNSPDSNDVRIPYIVRDVDGDDVSLDIRTDNSLVATAISSSEPGALVVTPGAFGTARISISASDGETTTIAETQFEVRTVEKQVSLSIAAPDLEAVRVENTSQNAVDFLLDNNGNPIFESIEDMVSHVRSMAGRFPGEPFERKLWRFVRDSSVHEYPLMPLQFANAPWASINSLGFGFCGDIATSYVAIARAAGYEARVWSLGGHVVPEILIDDSWRMYDPDLAIYYYLPSGEIAGVQDLQNDPNLVSDPVAPIFLTEHTGYSDLVAGIYATATDNIIADNILLPTVKSVSGRFVLPPAASLTFPGRWTETPMAYVAIAEHLFFESNLPQWREIAVAVNEPRAVPVEFFQQAKLDLPAGWAGELPLPLWLWDVQGVGSVEIDGTEFDAGSSDLVERLRYRVPPRSIRIVRSNGLSLIMMINAITYKLLPENRVTVTGKDVWALSTTVVAETQKANFTATSAPQARKKPDRF